ncbi:aldose 1-epimerase [Legionella sp. W05-934-2]|uniref:aldose 1-epimerase n=1 Tax=Legionella sp. W05-934-2 TaxID=1198649 RepID=UPI003462CBCA
MYTYQQFQLGKHHLVRFYDECIGNELTLCLTKGGTWTRLMINGQSIIDGYQTEAELDELPAAKNVFLFPFVNRLKDGRLSWQGQTYDWPINDACYHHAIHGFGMHLPMQWTIQSLSPLVFDIYTHYPGHYPYYPFAFEFCATHQLGDFGELRVIMQVKNVAKTSFPFAMGFHPYFQIASSIDECYLDIPPVDKLELDHRMMPTENVVAIQETKHQSLSKTTYDDCFQVKQLNSIAHTRLSNPTNELIIWQQVGAYGLNYLQIYTPPPRKSIALEPMTSAVDGLNNRMGAWILKPGERRDVSWGVIVPLSK